MYFRKQDAGEAFVWEAGLNYMEKEQQVRQPPEVEDFNQAKLGSVRMQFANNDPGLRLNQLAASLVGTTVEFNPETWVSVTSRQNASTGKIIVGGAALPPEIKVAFGWGVESKEDEILLKAAHELSHEFQRSSGLENSLVSFLSGSNDINVTHQSYLELYAFLGQHGRVSGLSNLEIYHHQSEAERGRVTTGLAVDMNIIEDITELIAAYSLGDEYFNYRLNKSHLAGDRKLRLAELVVQTFHNCIKV